MDYPIEINDKNSHEVMNLVKEIQKENFNPFLIPRVNSLRVGCVLTLSGNESDINHFVELLRIRKVIS